MEATYLVGPIRAILVDRHHVCDQHYGSLKLNSNWRFLRTATCHTVLLGVSTSILARTYLTR
jgi:hypothetical protein